MTETTPREEQLQAFVDGRLDERSHAAVLAWLGQRPEELARLAEYAGLQQELRRRVHDVPLPADDPKTLRLQQDLARRLERPDRRIWLRRAAAVVLLLGTGWWSNTLYQHYVRLPPIVVGAAQAHHVFGGETERPVELYASAYKEMAAWFSSQLGEPVQIPSLRSVGLRLVGGRLLPGEQGPIAQLLYEDGSGRRLTLALSSDPAELGPEFQLVELEGLTAGYWQDGEITYVVVAETSEQQLTAIASELGAQQPRRLL